MLPFCRCQPLVVPLAKVNLNESRSVTFNLQSFFFFSILQKPGNLAGVEQQQLARRGFLSPKVDRQEDTGSRIQDEARCPPSRAEQRLSLALCKCLPLTKERVHTDNTHESVCLEEEEVKSYRQREHYLHPQVKTVCLLTSDVSRETYTK